MTAGGAIGGVLGVLAGIGALAIPGVGPLISRPDHGRICGPGRRRRGGRTGRRLMGMGIPEYEAERYEGRVKGGGTLLSVHCDTADQISRAKKSQGDCRGGHCFDQRSQLPPQRLCGLKGAAMRNTHMALCAAALLAPIAAALAQAPDNSKLNAAPVNSSDPPASRTGRRTAIRN